MRFVRSSLEQQQIRMFLYKSCLSVDRSVYCLVKYFQELGLRIVAGLENYVGKNIHAICGKYGDAPHTNNCAHFIGHVLGYRLPGAALCSNCAGTKYTYAE